MGVLVLERPAFAGSSFLSCFDDFLKFAEEINDRIVSFYNQTIKKSLSSSFYELNIYALIFKVSKHCNGIAPRQAIITAIIMISSHEDYLLGEFSWYHEALAQGFSSLCGVTSEIRIPLLKKD